MRRGYQRTRWRDGRDWLWIGVRKQTGRGEGQSGVAFDQAINVPQPRVRAALQLGTHISRAELEQLEPRWAVATK
ncbi:MAG TPA: hypothetical protein VN380_15220 [Thermoanaerobaculia bacterium]|nr:hypothetical protein [Thermoanaerobaculia bacterium]